MTDKITFFYCTGTAFGVSMFENALKVNGLFSYIWGDPSVNPDKQPQVTSYVSGLNGKTYPWDGAVYNDPFPFMLNTDVWEPVRVAYADAAATFMVGGTIVGGMGASIDDGISRVMQKINALPPGAPFAIGGYSQGAAVMSGIYNEIRYGSLTNRASSFLGGVCFGNPRRQINHRGEVGGTWSGSWDVEGSHTGGHGSFPATGPWARLSNCDGTKWVDFANPGDIITSTGDSSLGQFWTQGNDALLGLLYSEFAGPLLQGVLQSLIPGGVSQIISSIQAAFTAGGTFNYLLDVVGTQVGISGAGHVLYPYLPPPNNTTGVIPSIEVPITTEYTTTLPPKSNVVGANPRVGRLKGGTGPTSVTKTYLKPDGETCYQIALKWLEGKAAAYATAPLVLPTTGSAGWSTTLVPPAS